MQIQLWSYNYTPEPSGIAPVSATVARGLRSRGHDVEVIAAHPHYPDSRWGRRLTPYREVRDGIPILRLPLWAGRANTFERIRQEATYAGSLTLALTTLPTPDVILVVSPSFPALGPAMIHARIRRVPWALWVQDILPDAAAAAGLMKEGWLMRQARRFELAAYRAAPRIVVISDSFVENLREKGVPTGKVERIYNPATHPIRSELRPSEDIDDRLVLTMGNIGHTQNLVELTRAYEASEELQALSTRFVITGDGVARDEVRAAIRTQRVVVTGLLSPDELEEELGRAAVAIVSQRYEAVDFNVPSKLMNFMACGIPVVASVRLDSEVARIVQASGGGWVIDSGDPAEFAAALARAIKDPAERRSRGEAGLRFAQQHFAADTIAAQFERVLLEVHSRTQGTGRR